MTDHDLDRLRTELASLSERVSRLEAHSPSLVAPASSPGLSRVTLINRIGAVTVAIGIIFFFKYAVDENLINAALGVALGVLTGLLLVTAGVWLSTRGQPIFAQGLAGCGLAALYISLYASFAFYHLIGQAVGFFALLMVSIGAMTLSVRLASSAIASLAVAGALLTPLLLHGKASESVLDCFYMAIVVAAALIIAVRRNWAPLAIVSVLLSLLAALAFFERNAWLFVAFAATIGVAHAAAAALSERSSSVRAAAYLLAHVALLSAGLRAASLLIANRNAAYEAVSILLACWGLAMLAWGLAKQSTLNLRLGLTLLGLVILKLYIWDVWTLDRVYRITAFLGLGFLLLLASWIYSRRHA